jgi:hypothetical protein
VIVAIFERSNRCAASTADTIAPSKADKSQDSSVTKNFLARLKKADGPFDTLTAMTCRGGWSEASSLPRSEDCSESVPVMTVSNVGVAGDDGATSDFLSNFNEAVAIVISFASEVSDDLVGDSLARVFTTTLMSLDDSSALRSA